MIKVVFRSVGTQFLFLSLKTNKSCQVCQFFCALFIGDQELKVTVGKETLVN